MRLRPEGLGRRQNLKHGARRKRAAGLCMPSFLLLAPGVESTSNNDGFVEDALIRQKDYDENNNDDGGHDDDRRHC